MHEMMNEMPGYNPYDALDEDTMSCMKDMEEGKTINQLRQMGQYFSDCARKVLDYTENNLTMEDFEKIKGKDLDNDKEAGEPQEYS